MRVFDAVRDCYVLESGFVRRNPALALSEREPCLGDCLAPVEQNQVGDFCVEPPIPLSSVRLPRPRVQYQLVPYLLGPVGIV